MPRNISRYRRGVRLWVIVLLVACGKDAARHDPPPAAPRETAKPPPDAGSPPAPQADTYPDLAATLGAIIPADARVVGFGEIHARTDRAQVRSALARFTTDALPSLGSKLSDLVVETWIVDPNCGKAATEATAKVQVTMRRPQETKSEIAQLADAAKA